MALWRYIQRCFSFLWRTLDQGRRIFINLLFLVFLIFILIGIFSGGKKLEDKTALILELRGNLVEQATFGPTQLLMLEAQGEKKYYTQLRDVLQALDAAAQDPKISSLVLMLDDMQNAGLPMLREIAAGLERFKVSNKKIIAWGSRFNQRQYFLASHADEIYLHPMGLVMLEGFGGYRNYYRDALDKLGVTVNTMRVGTFKSFVEPFTSNGPSDEALAAEVSLYNDLWATYTNDVERVRKLEAGSIMRMINDLPAQVKRANGNLATLALDNKLVDGLKTRDELRQLMLERGVRDQQTKSFRQIGYEGYLARQISPYGGDVIGVVVAEGEISDGVAPPGVVGGLSTANLIRKAREDDQIKALVLRVNSPGGSAFASELIRRELEITRQAGKPVIVSMGNVAASGGYWISMSADEVFADPATITGSIGVFTLLPTAEKAMEKIGVHSGGMTTTWLRGGYDPTRAIDPRFAELVQQGVNHIYADFIDKAAVARKTTPEKINEVAQGRVWSGRQAKEHGLIDSLGSYTDALQAAARKAQLTGSYAVHYLEPELTGWDRFFKIIDTSFAKIITGQLEQFGLLHFSALPAAVPPAATQEVVKEMRWLADFTERDQAFSVVTHCMCSVP